MLLGESAVAVISPRSLPAPFLWLLLAAIAFSSAPLKAQTRATHTLNAPQRIAALIEPAKLATLAARGANPRVQKYVAQMEEARQSGQDPEQVAEEAVRLTGMTGDAATLTLEAMLRNLTIAQRLGCLTPEGLAEMRRGRSPTITLGPYAGDQLSVDHIIPFSLAPTLDKVIANLELMPLKMNIRKRDAMGERQQALALRLKRAGLF